jgi:hypothetical protein
MPTITARAKRVYVEEIPEKKLDPQELITNKDQILKRVQRRAEGYHFINKTQQAHYLVFNILAVSDRQRSSLCRSSG